MPVIKKRAAASKKQSRQEIEAITNSLSTFMSANRKIITIVLACAAAAVLFFSGYALKASFDEKSAGPLFAGAYEVYVQAAGSDGDYSRALDLFRSIQKKYPASVSGASAAYYAGNMRVARGSASLLPS